MSLERQGILKFRGKDITIVGADLKAGEQAPEFTVQDLEWSSFNGLADTQGKVRIIASALSLETDVCDREIKRFNQEAASLSKDIAVLVITSDLPFTQSHWCGAAGVDQVRVLSDHMTAEFGEKYGVMMKETRTLRRAIFVVDRSGKLTYVAYMPALGVEPDYEEVLKAAEAALQ